MQPELRIPAQTGELSVSQNRVLRNTYLMLSLTMIPTLIGAMICMQLNFGIMRTNPIMSFVVIMAVFYGMVFAIEKNKDSGLGVALLLGFTFLMGLLLAPLLQVALGLSNGGQIIAMAAAGTGVSFFSMAAIATVTKRGRCRNSNQTSGQLARRQQLAERSSPMLGNVLSWLMGISDFIELAKTKQS